jgi:hypothetical protein
MTDLSRFASRRIVISHGKQIEVETLPSKAAPRRARSEETFARIPHERALKLYKRIRSAPWTIVFELDRIILMSKGRNPVPLNHERLYAAGMTRSAIYKALQQLQKAGVIRVEHWAKHAKDDTLVTHCWYPTAR